MREHRGISYMRTTREATPVLYEPGESFEIGGSRTLRSGDEDGVTLIGAGITLRECLAAAEELAGKGIAARVIDLYSVKPVDADAILAAARETKAMVTVEDHWIGGRDRRDRRRRPRRAASATPLVRLAVTERPGSGPPADLLAAAGIDAAQHRRRGRSGLVVCLDRRRLSRCPASLGVVGDAEAWTGVSSVCLGRPVAGVAAFESDSAARAPRRP